MASSSATQGVLAQRKIVKVKRHVQATGEVVTETPARPAVFKLVGALSGQSTSVDSKTNAPTEA